MSNIDKPIYRWKALDERNPMVYDILGIDRVEQVFCFSESKIWSKMTQMDITLSKLNFFLILHHHMIAYMPRIISISRFITQQGQGGKSPQGHPSKKSQPHLAPSDHRETLATKHFHLTVARKEVPVGTPYDPPNCVY